MTDTTNPRLWQEVAQRMQIHREQTFAAVDPPIPQLPDSAEFNRSFARNVTGAPKRFLSKEVVEITESSPETLIASLAAAKLSCLEVTIAFLQRAGLASHLTNCVTELLPERAIARAKYLDDYLNEHQKPIGPLHGLPISVKEHLWMKGLDINAGFISWVGTIAPDDALILKLLWKAGAVFYARTTEPQTLMHLETSSNIYGVTLNPYNTGLTSGGSSGGEGALLGLKGSCLGIGTDIGGSIRSPAANNGVFGLRPTTYRLPLRGMAATMAGEEQVVPVVGPLSTSLEGVKAFMKSIIDQKPWLYDPSLIPMPWRDNSKGSLLRTDSSGKRKLKIGILSDDGIVKPHPPTLRGINALVAKLKDNPDVEIVDFPPYKHDEAWQILRPLYFADGGKEEYDAMKESGEPLRPMSQFILNECNPDSKELTIPEVWKMTCEREAYKAQYTAHWNSVGTSLEADAVVDAADLESTVDVILCPTGPGVAPLIDTAKYWGYTAQWNLLDYPCLIFPTGLQCNSEDTKDESYQPRNEKDKYNHDLCESRRVALFDHGES